MSRAVIVGVVVGGVGGLVVVRVIDAVLGIDYDQLSVHHATPARLIVSAMVVLIYAVAAGLLSVRLLQPERDPSPPTRTPPD